MENLFTVAGKVAVITGGLGQLGQQFSLTLAKQGAKVAILDLPRPNYSLVAELQEFLNSGQVSVYSCDITVRSQVQKCLEQIRETFGTPEVLVNNAALDSPPNAPASENGAFEEYPVESLDKILNVNIKGSFICCQVFGNAMAKFGKGSIINIASIYGVLSPVQDIYEYKRTNDQLWFKPAAYGMSKAALVNLTKYLSTYWAKKGVRVNAISPAGIFNNQDERFLSEYLPRVPMGRMANPNEINGAIVFLASEASSYITGVNLLIDGGWTSW